MAYAADRLYDEDIRSRMGFLATKVKVREIVGYLPCLTTTDQEEIEAKREIAGNYNAMIVLLDNLRRRENWPDQFILALRKCEQHTLANSISDAYNRIRGIHSIHTPPPAPVPVPAPAPAAAAAAPISAPFPAEASATVTTATIHKNPCSTPPLLTPSVQTPAQSVTPAPINSFPRPQPNEAAPDSADRHAVVSAPDDPVHTPPKSAHPAKPVLSVIAPDARPASPVSAASLTPSVGQTKVSVDARELPTLGISDSLTNALSGSSPHAPTLSTNPSSSEINNPGTTFQPPALPEKGLVGDSTSMKPPVQDTNPPRTVSAQDLQNNTTINQVGEIVHNLFPPNRQSQETSQTTAQASNSASTGAVAGCLSNFADEHQEHFSKPGVLRGEEPLSFISDPNLQISNMTAERSPIQPARSQTVPNMVEEPVNEPVSVPNNRMSSSSTTVQNSSPRSFENGFPEQDNGSYPHQPVEDVYESLQTREHFVQFTENPSFQNLSGQPSSMVRQATVDQIHKSEAESLVRSVPEAQPSQQISEGIQRNNASEHASQAASFPTTAESDQATSLSSYQAQSELSEESQGMLDRFHLIAGAVLGIAVVLVAFRFKH